MFPFLTILSRSFCKVWYGHYAFRIHNKSKPNPSAHKFAVSIVNGSYLSWLLYDSLLYFSYRQAWWRLLYVVETFSYHLQLLQLSCALMGYIFYYYLYRSALGPTHVFRTTGILGTAYGNKSSRGVDVAATFHAPTYIAGKLQFTLECSNTWSFLLRLLQRPLWFLADFHRIA